MLTLCKEQGRGKIYRIVIKQSVSIIVMLTLCKEEGRVRPIELYGNRVFLSLLYVNTLQREHWDFSTNNSSYYKKGVSKFI